MKYNINSPAQRRALFFCFEQFDKPISNKKAIQLSHKNNIFIQPYQHLPKACCLNHMGWCIGTPNIIHSTPFGQSRFQIDLCFLFPIQKIMLFSMNLSMFFAYPTKSPGNKSLNVSGFHSNSLPQGFPKSLKVGSWWGFCGIAMALPFF